MSDVVKATT